jgi:magnesium chelatase family protein
MSCALHGIDGILVDVEVSILPGLPSFDIVGLGDSAVRESRNRVHAALRNNGYAFPGARLIASYAPAWLRKEGSAYDLPLALAILAASGQIELPSAAVCVFGELGLSGAVRAVPGAFCRALAWRDMRQGLAPGFLIAPACNQAEVASVLPIGFCPVRHLGEAVNGLQQLAAGHIPRRTAPASDDFKTAGRGEQPARVASSVHIVGQRKAMRSLQIAAAGRHNLLLLGSPGCGKSAIAGQLPSLLPPLTDQEAVEVTRIYSACGMLGSGEGLMRRRPFRAPHHALSRAALVGGGAVPVPGEISLAHGGVLFLDEMTEFRPEVLDLLRQPLEEHQVRLARLRHTLVYPADFLLVGAANPCRCGEYLEPQSCCRCSAESVREHLGRLSGPLLDRIDLVCEMTRLPAEHLSATVKPAAADANGLDADRIAACQAVQLARCRRQQIQPGLNGQITSCQLASDLALTDPVIDFAARSAGRLQLSVRAYQKILRIARTIADLDGLSVVTCDHVAEALQYRLQQH